MQESLEKNLISDKKKESQRKWHRDRPEYGREQSRRWRKENPEKAMLMAARHRAKKSGLEFNIDETDIVYPKLCPILNIKITREGDRANSPSLDRVDTLQGYIKGNVRVISHKANAAKRDLTVQQIENLYRYSRGEL